MLPSSASEPRESSHAAEPRAASDINTAMIPKLIEATTEVFETMVFTTLEVGQPIVDGKQPVAQVVGAVRFLGTVSGTVSFYSSDAVAREIAGALLGISPEEARNDVADTVGEITNMIAGTLRGKLTQSGETLMITPPTVTCGSDFCAQHFDVAASSLCPFKMREQELFVEVILQST